LALVGWEILDVVGEGASAVVYRARGVDGTIAALKIAKSNDGWVGREAALLANIARRWGPHLLDAGRVSASAASLTQGAICAGASYVVTSWVDGEPLDRLVLATKERERSRLAARVAFGVGAGLDELHGMGVRHGDVKLSNILVPAQREHEHPMLIDMGLAALVDGTEITGGTPRYFAPELTLGQAATPAADLYALGIVLAEILHPEIASASDPRAVLDAAFADGEIGTWIEALVARSPGARPAASWIAERASRLLGLAIDRDEIVEARKARVRRAYLAVRADDLGRATKVAPAIGGAPRAWLEEAIALAARVAPPATHPGEARMLAPFDALCTARWLVALVGPSAASWPVPRDDEGEMASRLLTLCEFAPPDAWTLADVARDASRARHDEIALDDDDGASSNRWVSMTRALLGRRPDARIMARAEHEIAKERAPASLAVDLAAALLRRGEIGRAFVAIARAAHVGASAEAIVLFAEIARRREDAAAAEAAARRVVSGISTFAGDAEDHAHAILARLAWDRGALEEAERAIGSARGGAAAEVRALIAYARGDFDRGLRIIEEASHEPSDALGSARMAATRGMLEHARGDASASLAAFSAAVELATREGAVIEEATYLTGLAASAVDAGAVDRALLASTRAALLWERLGRPALAARAWLSRASAFALVGAAHEADEAARFAMMRARRSGDHRAAAFARWAIVETRTPGDARAREEAQAADMELTKIDASANEASWSDDRIRAAARVLVWADGVAGDGQSVPVLIIDEHIARGPSTAPSALSARLSAGPQAATPARVEWWGARARALLAQKRKTGAWAEASRVLGEITSLVDLPAPVGSRGPAFDAGAELASELGSGDVARRLETARRAAADALRAGAPPAHRASLASVLWARTSDSSSPGLTSLGSAQVTELETIVRALSSRDRLKPLLEQVLDTMVLWTGVERGLLLLRAPDGNLVPRAARNLARRDLRGEQLALSKGIAKQAMEERQAVVATDTQIGNLHASVHALRLRSVLAVPLVARGNVLGVVYLDDRVRRDAFGPSELAWVRLVASQAALAIADARDQALLRRAVRRAERANADLESTLGAREAELATVRSELAQGQETRFRYDAIVGRSEPVRAMLRLVDRVTTSEVPVLLVGESGTGKELVARAIHHNGPRARKSFVSENCGSVPESLLESTLFGHVRGAFTGASSTRAGLFDIAHGGTLLLDEIGEMPLTMQTKLLRVLQDGEVWPVGSERVHHVDVRIITATHRDLEAMVAKGTFREDLFYRLNVVAVRVPALRERAADIPILVLHFIEKHGGGRKLKVTRAAMDRLTAYPWPGNVRQLENEIRRAIVLADDRIDVDDLSDDVARGGPAAGRDAGLGLKARVDALELQLVRDALAKTKGNQTKAAKALGMSRFGLQKMMRRLGIDTP